MKKLLIFIAAVILLPNLWFACNDSKTYAELLEDEQKAIGRLIADSNFTVLYSFPEKFGSKDYVKLPNGLYMNVIDFGNKDEKIDSGKVVLYRYRSYRNLFDTITYTGNINNADPSSFIFGLTPTSSNGYIEGLATPLSFVGNGAKVNLIIPSALNSYSIMQNVTPYYFQNVSYQESMYEY